MAPTLAARLQHHPLFREYEKAWTPVLGDLRLRRCSKDDVLAQHGEAASAVYVVLSGWVMLVRHTPDGREVTIGLCSDGDIFGEAGLFPHANYPNTAQVLQAGTEVLEIPSALLRGLMQAHPDLSHALMEELGKRVTAAQLQLEQMSSLTAGQRLGCFLLRLCQSQSAQFPNLSIPVGKNVIASYLGMKPETLSRSFQQLAQIGVEIKGSHAEVKDIDQLRSFVCDSCGESGLCVTEQTLPKQSLKN